MASHHGWNKMSNHLPAQSSFLGGCRKIFYLHYSLLLWTIIYCLFGFRSWSFWTEVHFLLALSESCYSHTRLGLTSVHQSGGGVRKTLVFICLCLFWSLLLCVFVPAAEQSAFLRKPRSSKDCFKSLWDKQMGVLIDVTASPRLHSFICHLYGNSDCTRFFFHLSNSECLQYQRKVCQNNIDMFRLVYLTECFKTSLHGAEWTENQSELMFRGWFS